jgi:hypothetical protein
MRIPEDRQKGFKALVKEMQVSDDFSPGTFILTLKIFTRNVQK